MLEPIGEARTLYREAVLSIDSGKCSRTVGVAPLVVETKRVEHAFVGTDVDMYQSGPLAAGLSERGHRLPAVPQSFARRAVVSVEYGRSASTRHCGRQAARQRVDHAIDDDWRGRGGEVVRHPSRFE